MGYTLSFHILGPVNQTTLKKELRGPIPRNGDRISWNADWADEYVRAVIYTYDQTDTPEVIVSVLSKSNTITEYQAILSALKLRDFAR